MVTKIAFDAVYNVFQSLFSGLLFKSKAEKITLLKKIIGFNPFFQVFFLNLRGKGERMEKKMERFNPFFQVFFLNRAIGCLY